MLAFFDLTQDRHEAERAVEVEDLDEEAARNVELLDIFLLACEDCLRAVRHDLVEDVGAQRSLVALIGWV